MSKIKKVAKLAKAGYKVAKTSAKVGYKTGKVVGKATAKASKVPGKKVKAAVAGGAAAGAAVTHKAHTYKKKRAGTPGSTRGPSTRR